MRASKISLLLLLCLCFLLLISSTATKAASAEEDLRVSVQRVNSIAGSQSNALALIAKNYFKTHPVAVLDFTSPDFKVFVESLVREKNKLPADKRFGLAQAIEDLDGKYTAYVASSDAGAGSSNQNARGGNDNTAAGGGTAGNTKNSNQGDGTGAGSTESDWSIVDYFIAAAGAVAGLLILAALVYSLMTLSTLRRTTDEHFTGVLPKAFGGIKSRQDELAKQIAATGDANKDIMQKLADVQTEIRQMSRMLQQNALTSNRSAMPAPIYVEPEAVRVNDIPAFPIAAEELLRQMQGKSMVVKRDFQNDMLVSDPDSKGELILLRDSQFADETQPLFIVPSVTQFQMRQEYYNFYAKYYECSRPESGAVWIIEPAVVEKVSGGWQLREKGILEVR